MPILVAMVLACPGAVAGQEVRPLEKIPVHKVDLERVYAEPGGVEKRVRDEDRLDVMVERNHYVHSLLEGHHVSQRSRERLAAAGLGPALTLDGAATKQSKTTLRVLLVRVGFETDVSGDLTSVTEDGNFQLGGPGDSDVIDPPPHDKTYFEAHLAGLGEYYNCQSGGLLSIESEVLPPGDNDCYFLSDLADYGPGEGANWTLAGLEALVRDMIQLADAELPADGYNLADYDDDDDLTYVIFVHAGADWQSDISGDSPNDVPTFFVELGEPEVLTSTDSETGLPGELSNCSIIPETTSQDGWLGSIAGGLYHEFGHALGLPDIYDTYTGLPAVGYWDLMDSGPNLIANVGFYHPTIEDSIVTYSVAGLLPPSLSAWCKWYLGWLDIETITGEAWDVHLPAVQVAKEDYRTWYSGTSYDGDVYDFNRNYPQALIGGVSSREFWLMENRWVPLSSDDLPDVTGIGFVRDSDTGVFLYMGGDYVDPDGPGPLGEVPRNTGMYDYFLPDGGLLVWHVNRDRIDTEMSDNMINAYGDGLKLLEADGMQDVGVYEAYTIGFYGSSNDAFHAGINDHLGRDGRPSTRAYDYSWTGLELVDISSNDATMTFEASVLPLVETAPIALSAAGDLARTLHPETLTPWRATGVDGDDASRELLVMASAPTVEDEVTIAAAHLYVFDTAGAEAVDEPAGAPDGALIELESPLAGPPLVAAFGGTGRDHLVVGTRDGQVRAWDDEVVADALPLTWGPVAAGDTLAFAPVPAHLSDGTLRLLCCLEPGVLQVLDESGARVGTPYALDTVAGEDVGRFAAPPHPLTQPYGEDRWVVVTERFWFLIDPAAEDGAPLDSGALGVTPDDEGRLATALWQQDGESRLIVVGTDGPEVFRYRAHLAVERSDWPEVGGEILGEIAVADVDGDGNHDLVFVTATHLYARAVNGVVLSGFPLELLNQFPLDSDTGLDGGLAVFDADGDGRNEIYATTDQGHLMGWDAAGERLERLPLLWGDRGTSALAVGPHPDGGRVLWMADTGGRVTDHSRANPSGGRVVGLLPASAVDAGGTSEWLGPLGGAARCGSTGTPADLGDASLMAAEEDRFFAYPNPARGERAIFRYHSPLAGTARLVIYNLEGEEVATLTHEGAAGAVEEIDWPLDGLASGVYLCRLDAPASDGGRSRRVIRLAVER